MSQQSEVGGVLSDKYTVPPFSILDMASGPWQELKRRWLDLGIKSEEGRDENLHGYSELILEKGGKGTSVFDPVLCELMYKWFAPPTGQVVDPFAGGSVRGIVAGVLRRKYWGCDLREEQVAANRKQAEEINKIPGALRPMPEWLVGDSFVKLNEAPDADFIFSCPPYGDLEVYSDDERDLSQMKHDKFLETYREIIRKSVHLLRDDSFACFVVGDYRDDDGYLSDFVSETIRAFKDEGARLYNNFILATPKGSAAQRAAGMFDPYRVAVPVHQNVLVFCNGDRKEAAAKNKL